ncbi:MAG: Gfo/Idh/MocA family oxidoreductase [Planctomycetes bacterium]|nr:Gfo/Idh/MocA family oxidoreductase [Planctomycetota bacterium]
MQLSKTFRVGALGLTHDHVWRNLRDLLGTSHGLLTAVADQNKPLLERAKQEFECATYKDFQTLLDRERLDAVYLFGDNALSVDMTEAAAARGMHVFVEKPMAADLIGADRMLAACRRNNVRLMVNWPFAWRPQLQHALSLAKSGTIGRIWQMKYRAAHEGPLEHGCSPYFVSWLYDPELNGAGALMDYGCYGTCLANYLLGLPNRVTAVGGRYCKEDVLAEDNAVILMSYPRAMAIAEASWTQIGDLTAYETVIYGTAGTIFVEAKEDGRVLLATAENPAGAPVDVPPLPQHMQNASANFVYCLETDEEFAPLCDARTARDAQEVLEAALMSIDSGADVSLPLRNA